MTQYEDQLQYTECFVAYIDILGFQKLIQRSADDSALLAVLTRTLNAMAALPSGIKESSYLSPNGQWVERRWKVQTRSFSDTVVVFMPVEGGSLSQMLFMVRYLHDRVLELGMCMRGAVTMGEMYWNDTWGLSAVGNGLQHNEKLPITLGPGLIEAYDLESNCATYPRVLVGQKLFDHVDQYQINCYPFGPNTPVDRPLTGFFRKDADGLYFLDLLHPDIMRNDSELIVQGTDSDSFSIRWTNENNTYQIVMSNAKRLIDKWLGKPDCTEKIRAKYEWLKTYLRHVEEE